MTVNPSHLVNFLNLNIFHLIRRLGKWRLFMTWCCKMNIFLNFSYSLLLASTYRIYISWHPALWHPEYSLIGLSILRTRSRLALSQYAIMHLNPTYKHHTDNHFDIAFLFISGCGSFPKVHTSDYLPVGDQSYGSHLGSFSEQLSYPQGSGMLQMGTFHGLMSPQGPGELPGSSVNSSLVFESPTPGKAKRKRTACPVCNRLFSDQRAMLYHKESAHEDKVFPCECGKVYKHKPNLMAHAKRCGYRLTLVQKVDWFHRNCLLL